MHGPKGYLNVKSLPCQREGDRRKEVEGFRSTIYVGEQRESPRHFVAHPPLTRGGCVLSDTFGRAFCAFCELNPGYQCSSNR